MLTLTGFLRVYLRTICLFVAFDFVWLSEIAPAFYREHIGHLMADKPHIPSAAVFYLIFIAGVVWFAVLPSIQKFSFRSAFGRGAFFGVVTYATFDLTSQAVFKDWPVLVTIVDLCWGGALTGMTTAASAYFSRRELVH